jgi:predicted transcriptional regulator
MTLSKRSRVEIYSDILELLHTESKLRKVSPTRLAHQANLPYDRFQKILDHLIVTGMILQKDEGLFLTDKGLNCLHEIKRSQDFLKRMGLYV